MASKLKYLVLIPVGFLIIYASSLLHHVTPPDAGEYYYTNWLRNNYTFLTAGLFLLAGLAAGYYFKLNPWGIGLCLVLLFPIASFYEMTVYRGSHNLIPFELIIHFLMALPAIAGAFLGKLLNKKRNERKL
ncbi:hypothetical protein [Flavobacterium phycosphaerae]|uniref:hypothetical protein n=1 Tax=Flavobacterium phycosphaerae TaxID=2697515 RepID=UPI00138947CA|nr:hypothetical protein [Flavobacterium phycosphaerae]